MPRQSEAVIDVKASPDVIAEVLDVVKTAVSRKNCSKCATTNDASAPKCMVCGCTKFHAAAAPKPAMHTHAKA